MKECVEQCGSDEYFIPEIVDEDTTLKYCYEECPADHPQRGNYNECITCQDLLGEEDAIFDDGRCRLCSDMNPRYPVLKDGECVTCKDAFPDRPYWNFTSCVATQPRKSYYVSGVVLIIVTFIAISILKLFAYRQKVQRRSVSVCKNITLVFIFLCIAAVAGLLFAVAFADMEGNTLVYLLVAIGACFIVATFITAYFVGLEDDKGNNGYHGEDQDSDPPKLLRDLVAKGKREDQKF